MRTFKRSESGGWYYEFRYRGKPYKRGGFSTAKIAETAGKAARRMIEQGYIAEYKALSNRQPSPYARLQDIRARYRDITHASPATITANLNNWDLLLARLEIQPTAKADKLNPAAIRKWYRIAQSNLTGDQQNDRSAKVTANSILNSALSILADKLLPHYQDAGLKLPDYTDLRRTVKAEAFALPRKDYHPPAPEIIAATLRDWEQLDDRNLFLAIGWILSFGLRKSNVTSARWDWIRQEHGHWILDVETPTKNRTGRLRIQALAPYFTNMLAVARRHGWTTGPVLRGSKTDTHDNTFRRLSHFLTDHGWAMQKKAHALRDYAISCVAAKFGIYDASLFAQHATVTQTQTNYSNFVAQMKFIPDDKKPWHWAKVDADDQTTLQIVAA